MCVCVCVCAVLLPQFLSEVEAWCKVCSEGGLPSEMQELEIAIHRHQSLYEQVTQAYTEVNQHGLATEICHADTRASTVRPQRLKPALYSDQNDISHCSGGFSVSDVDCDIVPVRLLTVV